MNTVAVIPFAGLEQKLSYGLPPHLASLAPGTLVRVPLQNRTRLALVTADRPDDIAPEKLKNLLDRVYAEPVVSPELIALGEWMQRYYAAGADAVFETMIPAAIRQETAAKETAVLEVARTLGEDELEKLRNRAPKQAQLYEFLAQQIKAVPKTRVLRRLKIGPASCKTLVEKGVIREKRLREERSAYSDVLGDAEHVSQKAFDLNDEQATAVEDLRGSLLANEFRTHLLHGVTGSGKTEVYLHAIQAALEAGQGVIFLVPEVALTPQTVGRLRARLEHLGHRVVVWHSHLSAGERFDAWFAMLRGEARVVVGARSAIFTPVQNLRLIVVDEEHEPAYKQSEVPRYHGRDVAVYRAMLNDGVVVLGSATPSLESLYNVQQKNYRLNRLTKRVDDRGLPKLHLVDMKNEKRRTDGIPHLSELLAEKLRDRFEKREQSILFLNRRGYASSMLCSACGHLAECPHCSVMLTYHRPDQLLKCHVCGYQTPAPENCSCCGKPDIRCRGFGTQRIEETLATLLPSAKIVRLDSDSMGKKNLFRQILADFRAGKIDLLVGTQMIAKGLDFPNVTLVGLVDADVALHSPDFRASERCFQLLVQVSGRAGRGDKAGEVVVQSLMPHSAPIQYARRGDFDGFLADELDQRREFNYPPFRHLVRHLFRGRNEDKVRFYAEKWAERLEAELQTPVEIRGPVPAPLEKIRDTFRYHLWYFIGNVSRVLPEIIAIRQEFPMNEDDVIDVFDVDPVDMS